MLGPGLFATGGGTTLEVRAGGGILDNALLECGANVVDATASDGEPLPDETDMTDRQREALEAAFRAGYFHWLRDSTAEEVAESLDIASPTLHSHIIGWTVCPVLPCFNLNSAEETRRVPRGLTPRRFTCARKPCPGRRKIYH
ncbi:hypothetical protein BRC95_08240 [Halobacteriales archaeon QS_5_68_33]|nr:MAG: hypothetical protein BRC95_08240 [Halobacteriales archaeon QS_5_68_33]